MEKRMILAIVLSIVILLAYQKMFGPGPADRPPPAKQQEAAGTAAGDNAMGTPAAAPGAVARPPAAGGLAPASIHPQRWITVRTPLYTATLSTAGGGSSPLP